jgi:hypothetical protein
MKKNKSIAIIGGGPSGLFLFKQVLKTCANTCTIDIFEASNELGAGMPYSAEGALKEHITNVSGNEIPALVTTVMEWLKSVSDKTLETYGLNRNRLNEYKVLPRLLFGEYLRSQFELLQQNASDKGVTVKVYYNTEVIDIIDNEEDGTVTLKTNKGNDYVYNHVGICTGHVWGKKHEGKTPGYFDSPYPPSKLARQFNHTVALKGSSLTAIDAIRTLARQHGEFEVKNGKTIGYKPHAKSPNFKMVMYSLNGLLPGIRFHLENPRMIEESMLSKEEIAAHILENDGFLSLDYIFEKDFKDVIKLKRPEFYEAIKNMDMEAFVEMVMSMRENVEPFTLFKMEYAEAEKSIRRKESVYWKEMLAALSFAMNYPAKYFSAEDMMRLKKVLMPLISIVIAFVPQSSCEEMLALHEAGLLDLIWVDKDSHEEPQEHGGVVYHHTDEAGQKHAIVYNTFVDCTGQKNLSLNDLPFKTLIKKGSVSAARLLFRYQSRAAAIMAEGNKEVVGEGGLLHLKVPGIAITDSFRVVGKNGFQNPRIFMMAVPYMGGLNPDYSGLDFCEEASKAITNDIFNGESSLLTSYQQEEMSC